MVVTEALILTEIMVTLNLNEHEQSLVKISKLQACNAHLPLESSVVYHKV